MPPPCPERVYELQNQRSNTRKSRVQEEEQRSNSPSREGFAMWE